MSALVAVLLLAALQPSAGFVGGGLWRPGGVTHRSSQSRVDAAREADAAGDSWAPAGADELPNDPNEVQVGEVRACSHVDDGCTARWHVYLQLGHLDVRSVVRVCTMLMLLTLTLTWTSTWRQSFSVADSSAAIGDDATILRYIVWRWIFGIVHRFDVDGRILSRVPEAGTRILRKGHETQQAEASGGHRPPHKAQAQPQRSAQAAPVPPVPMGADGDHLRRGDPHAQGLQRRGSVPGGREGSDAGRDQDG